MSAEYTLFSSRSGRQVRTNRLRLAVTGADSLAAFLPSTFESLLAGRLLFAVMKDAGDARRVRGTLEKFNRRDNFHTDTDKDLRGRSS